MTRANFLQAILGTAAAALGESSDQPAVEEFDPKGKHYVLTIPGFISIDQHELLKQQLLERFPGCQITVLDGGATLHEVRPLLATDIEAAVEAGVRRAIQKERLEKTCHVDDLPSHWFFGESPLKKS